ncbi:MAG: copper resistance system multicopper oxidase, partial [Nevskiales bacterium]
MSDMRMHQGEHVDTNMPMQPHGMESMKHEMPGMHMPTQTGAHRLNDPGIGLRNNGRRVLTYADLHSLFDDPDGRDPEREIELHLTGQMERYVWGFDDKKFAAAE